MKVIGLQETGKLICVLLALVPFLVQATLILILNVNSGFNLASIVVLGSTWLLLFFYLKVTAFTYSVRIENQEIFASSWFYKNHTFKQVDSISFSNINWVSLFFNVYSLRMNNKSFLVYNSLNTSYLSRFFGDNRHAPIVENKIRELIENELLYELC